MLRFKDSKDKLIRRAVLLLIPRLAAFAPERFATDYLSKCIAHVLSVLKHPGVCASKSLEHCSANSSSSLVSSKY